MEKKYKKLGKNTIIVFIGQAGSSLVSLLMLPLYTKWLSTEEYGTVDLMSTYASILLSIVTCCVADSIFVFPKNADNDGKKKYFSSGIAFVLITSISVAIVNFFLSDYYEDHSFFAQYSWYTLSLTASLFLQKYTQQFTMTLEKMTIYATTGIVYTLSVAILAILMIPIFKLDGYILSLIFANIISATYSFVFSKSYLYLGCFLSYVHLKELLYYGIPLIPNSIMWWMVNGLNRPIMEAYLGLSAIGLYAVASKFPGVVSMLVSIFSSAWNISVLDEFGKPQFEVFFNKTFRLISFMSFLLAFFLIVFSKQIIKFFTTEDFYEAWHVLPMLVIGVVLNTSTGLVGSIFMGMKKSKYFFYSSFASAVVSLVLTFMLIKNFGLIGCAVASALSFLVALVLRLRYAWEYIKGFDLIQYISIIIALVISNVILEVKLLFLYKLMMLSMIFVIILYRNRSLLKSVYSLNIVKWRKF